jgi:large subunit ribosomal protein L13
MIIDAKDLILGRLATVAARKALEGETVSIINCEKAVITGKKDTVFARQKMRMEMGHHIRGPFYYREPDFFVKRAIRGMIPHKTNRGSEAFKRIRCHVGVPVSLREQKAESLKNAHISQSNASDYVTVGLICKLQGAKRVK